MSGKKITLTRYESIITGDIYYGFREKDAMIKEIEDVKYIEVTPSIVKPEQMWVKLDSLKVNGEITFDRPRYHVSK
jgi:hypothetical protein